MFRMLAAIIRMALTLAFGPVRWLAGVSGWQPPVSAMDYAAAQLVTAHEPEDAPPAPSALAEEIKAVARDLLRSEREREERPRYNRVDLGPYGPWLALLDKPRLRIVAATDVRTIERWTQTVGIPDELFGPPTPAPAPAPKPALRVVGGSDGRGGGGGQKAKPSVEPTPTSELDLDAWVEDLQRGYGGPRR